MAVVDLAALAAHQVQLLQYMWSHAAKHTAAHTASLLISVHLLPVGTPLALHTTPVHQHELTSETRAGVLVWEGCVGVYLVHK